MSVDPSRLDYLVAVEAAARAFCEALQASEDDGQDERCIDTGHALWVLVMGQDVQDAVFVPDTGEE